MADENNDDAATAGAGRAAREAAARPPPAASPLRPSGYAAAGPGRREAERSTGARAPEPQERHIMSDDAELATLRSAVNCAAVLESMAGWKLDARESTRRALKYRRAKGEVLIVNHDGRGWWDPLSEAKGDAFSLVQHLDPGLNFGHVRQVLRRLIGLAPAYRTLVREPRDRRDVRSLDERWARRPRLRQG